MRRLVPVLAALLLIAPTGLRLAASSSDDAEALRCAIACGHAGKAGAACCPMSGAASKQGRTAAMAACPERDAPGALPAASAQPAILASVRPLPAPGGGSPAFSIPPSALTAFAPPPPDHVPLLLS